MQQSLFHPNPTILHTISLQLQLLYMYLTLHASSPGVLTPIIIPPQHDVNVTYWSFLYCISQSTILERIGSTAVHVSLTMTKWVEKKQLKTIKAKQNI